MGEILTREELPVATSVVPNPEVLLLPVEKIRRAL